jgi:hypothetical protein
MSEPESLNAIPDPTRASVKRVAEALGEETGAVAVLLTGPLAVGIDGPDDKLYFLAIIDSDDGVIEHRFLKDYADVDREMEIGIFPSNFVDKLISDGYWDMVSYRAAEALRSAVPLLDPTGYGAAGIGAMARHLPERRFVSGHIHKVVATFDDAMSLYAKEDYQGAVLVVREALRLAVELVLKTFSPGPDAGTNEVLKQALGDEAYDCLLQAVGAQGATDNDLERRLKDMLTLSKSILEDLGIASDFLD